MDDTPAVAATFPKRPHSKHTSNNSFTTPYHRVTAFLFDSVAAAAAADIHPIPRPPDFDNPMYAIVIVDNRTRAPPRHSDSAASSGRIAFARSIEVIGVTILPTLCF